MVMWGHVTYEHQWSFRPPLVV